MISTVTRIIRFLRRRCIVCGKRTGTISRSRWHNRPYYCSFECACYDGVFSVNSNSEINNKTPSLFKKGGK